ncbi:MAG: urease accessory protein UreD [Proteobacteria bacterium]|nr:urease accessory protein UreD [Pseudomonadota bacterium]MBU1420264.1 urease accessory protein UreD [Pseudomonadota bacterium]MBU1455593.1 urease accessory protein UreD [Pseudomonadota bacterium]
MSTVEMDSGASKGWSACLQLEFALRRERTVLVRNRHSGPLVVQRPLYPEGGVCHTCILHPPGGVVGGDRLEIDVLAEKDTATLITTPGATKFYRSDAKKVVQKQHVTVRDGAILEWFPQDSILFPGADAEISTRIDLAPKARFMGWEILCLGLPVNGEVFSSGRLLTSLVIYRHNTPLLIDRLRVTSSTDLERCAGLRGFPVIATFVATACTTEMLAPLRSLVPQEKKALYGVTLMDDLLVARYLGRSTFAAQGLFTQIWKTLRPKIVGKSACPPRIWAT